MNVGKVWDNLLSVPLLVVLKPHSQTLDKAENTWRSTSGLVFVTFKWPGVENDLNNIRIFVQTSVFLTFSPHGTTLMALIRMSIYRCLQMLDVLVSSHPSMTTKKSFTSLTAEVGGYPLQVSAHSRTHRYYPEPLGQRRHHSRPSWRLRRHLRRVDALPRLRRWLRLLFGKSGTVRRGVGAI